MKIPKLFQRSPLLAGVVLAIGSGAVLGAPQWVRGSSTVTNAIAGGAENGKALSVCRAAQGGGTHPGKRVGNNCNIGYGGKEVAVNEHELLTGLEKEVAWVAGKNGEAVKGAVAGGSEGGKTLSICRFKHESNFHPGKVVGTTCNIGYGGKEVTSSSYEVLTDAGTGTGTTTTSTATTAPASIQGGKLASEAVLESNQKLYTDNQSFYLFMDPSGKLGVFDKTGKNVAEIGSGSPGSRLKMNKDGTVSVPISSHKSVVKDSFMILTYDGELVIRAPGGKDIWSSKAEKSYGRLVAGQVLHGKWKLVSSNNEKAVLRIVEEDPDRGTFHYVLSAEVSGRRVWSQVLKSLPPLRLSPSLIVENDSLIFRAEGDFGALEGKNFIKSESDGLGGSYAEIDYEGVVLLKDAKGTVVWSSRLDKGILNKDRLLANEFLAKSLSLQSKNGSYLLNMQEGLGGHLRIMEKKGLDWVVKSTVYAGGSRLTFGSDGNLVLKNNVGGVVWFTGTAGTGYSSPYALITNDGKLQVVNGDGTEIWPLNDAAVKRAKTRLSKGEQLNLGDMIRSENGEYFAKLGTDANFVVIKKSSGEVIWTAISSLLITKVDGTYVAMQADGNLVQYDGLMKSVKWSTGTYGNAGAYAMVTDNGKLVVKNPSGAQIWPK
jgi:hypothetical protein